MVGCVWVQSTLFKDGDLYFGYTGLRGKGAGGDGRMGATSGRSTQEKHGKVRSYIWEKSWCCAPGFPWPAVELPRGRM